MQKTIDKQDEICYNDKVVRKNAGMAQSVEHVIGNDEVISSILITSSIKALAFAAGAFLYNMKTRQAFGSVGLFLHHYHVDNR